MSSTRHLALLDVPRPMREWTPDPSGEIGEVFTRRWVVDLMLDVNGHEDFPVGGQVVSLWAVG